MLRMLGVFLLEFQDNQKHVLYPYEIEVLIWLGLRQTEKKTKIEDCSILTIRLNIATIFSRGICTHRSQILARSFEI